MPRLVSPTDKPIVLKPVRPNAGLAALYRRKIMRLVDEMQASLTRWLIAAYRADTPATVAMDAPPPPPEDPETSAEALKARMDELTKHWTNAFDDLAPKVAEWFATEASERVRDNFKRTLSDAGFTVSFKMTDGERDAIQATMEQQVGLIKSIGRQHLAEVQQLVMRSVASGRDLGSLSKALRERYGVTKRRAALIATHQNNMATANLERERRLALGIEQAQWVHSGGGKHPRPSHAKAGREGVVFDVAKGWLDPDEGRRIQPGELINCFTGDSLVNLDNGCHKVWRHYYRGYVVVLESGNSTVRSTPNHPLLTNKGWVPAELVKRGDYVWEARRKIFQSGMDKDYVTQSRFDDLFDAILAVGKGKSIAGSGFDFHGDIPDSEVEAVWPEFGLPDKWNFASFQGIGKLLFSEANRKGAGTFKRVESAHPLVSGCFRDGSKFKIVRSGETNFVRLATAPNRKSHMDEPPDNESSGSSEVVRHLEDGHTGRVPLSDLLVVAGDRSLPFSNAGLVDDAADDSSAHPDMRSYIIERDPVIIKPEDIGDINVQASVALSALSRISHEPGFAEMLAEFVSVYAEVLGEAFACGEFVFNRRHVLDEFRREYYSGHVYTMESNTGYYTTGMTMTVAKNCRCFSRAIIPALKEE